MKVIIPGRLPKVIAPHSPLPQCENFALSIPQLNQFLIDHRNKILEGKGESWKWS